MPQLKGVYTALITPFNTKGALDEEGLRRNICDQISQGVAGVVVLGTTGEAPTLTDQEKVRVMQIAKEETAGKIHLMAGTGSNATEQSIRQSRLAEELGADSCLVINPYYNKPTQEGIYQHFKAIAKSIQIPLIIYHHPGRTGGRINPETIVRLSGILNIIGIKEASGDLAAIAHWMEQLNSDFCLFSGDDSLTLPTLAMGGHGVISVASNLAPSAMVCMVDAALQGDFKTARDLHHHLALLFRFLAVESNPIPIKAAMNHAGKASGTCRPPLTPLSESHLQLLKDSLPKVSHG